MTKDRLTPGEFEFRVTADSDSDSVRLLSSGRDSSELSVRCILVVQCYPSHQRVTEPPSSPEGVLFFKE